MEKYKKYFFVFLDGIYQGATIATSDGGAKGNVGFSKKILRGVDLAIFIKNSEAFSEKDSIPADLFRQIPDNIPKPRILKSDGKFKKFLEGRA